MIAGHKALGCSFFVSGSAVDLAGQEEAPGASQFLQAGPQARVGLREIVFYGVTGLQHGRLFQAREWSSKIRSLNRFRGSEVEMPFG